MAQVFDFRIISTDGQLPYPFVNVGGRLTANEDQGVVTFVVEDMELANKQIWENATGEVDVVDNQVVGKFEMSFRIDLANKTGTIDARSDQPYEDIGSWTAEDNGQAQVG